MSVAQQHPESGLIAVNGVQFSETKVTRDSLFPAQIGRLFDKDAETVSVDASELFWTTSQAMVPAGTLRAVGLSDLQFPLVNDWDLYLRIAEHYPVTFINRRLMRWRYHDRSASGPAYLRQLRWGEDGIRMTAKHLRRAPRARRGAFRRALRSQIFETARAAYDRTKPGQRETGLASLRRLLRWSHISLAPIMFLVAAYSPDWLTRTLGRVVQRTRHVS